MMDQKTAMVGVKVPASGIYICTAVTFLEKRDGSDLLLITFEGMADEALAFAENQTEFAKFINQSVSVTFRTEIVDRVNRVIVNQMSVLTKTSVIESEGRPKLFLEPGKLDKANISLRGVKRGEVTKNATLFCVGVEQGASAKADWCDFTVLDKHHRRAILRLFSPDVKDLDAVGKYIVCDVAVNQYGFNTNEIYITTAMETPLNPEVGIAVEYINTVLADMPIFFNDALKKCNYIDELSKIEEGMPLIEVAIALHLSQELINVSQSVNLGLVMQGILASKFYLLTKRNPDMISKEQAGFLTAVSSGISDRQVLHLLDGETPKMLFEKALISRLLDIASFINEFERTAYLHTKFVSSQ